MYSSIHSFNYLTHRNGNIESQEKTSSVGTKTGHKAKRFPGLLKPYNLECLIIILIVCFTIYEQNILYHNADFDFCINN